MVSKSSTTILTRYTLSFVLASALIFSFGLHSVQIEHMHFNQVHTEAKEQEHGHSFASLDVYMHLSEKKLFLFIPAVILSTSFFAYIALLLKTRTLMLANWYARMMQKQNAYKNRIHDYNTYFLRKGVFHSKAY